MNSIKKIFIAQNLDQVTAKIKFCLLFLIFANSVIACSLPGSNSLTGPKTTYTGTQSTDATTQGSSSDKKVTLADNEINRNHVYYEAFTKNSNPNFVELVYDISKQRAEQDVKFKQGHTAEVITNRGGNNSLIFKIKDGNEFYFDTLRNTIHPSTPGNEILGNAVPIAGTLPTGTMSRLENEPSNNTDLFVYLTEYDAQVKIDVSTTDDELVVNLVDRFLNRGDHRFTWEPGSEHIGQYHLHITVNGQKMTYKIDVE